VGELTDDDVTRLSGKREELSGTLQQKYGYNTVNANTAIVNWMKVAKKVTSPQLNPGRVSRPIEQSDETNGSARRRAVLQWHAQTAVISYWPHV
jgi:hypothetical protein